MSVVVEQLSPKQQEIYKLFFENNEIRWIVSVGGKGSGKSTLAVVILTDLFFDPRFKGSRILIGRESLRDLKNTLVRSFIKRLNELGIPKDVIYTNETLQVIRNEMNDVEIYYLSLSNRNEQYRSVLSYEFNVVIIDEADRISYEAFVEVSNRFRLMHPFQKGMIMLNPTPETHWIYREFVANPKPASVVVHSSTYDNFILKKFPKEKFYQETKVYEFEGKEYRYKDNIRYEVVKEVGDYVIVKQFNNTHLYYVEQEARPLSYRKIVLEGNWGAYSLDGGLYQLEFTWKNIADELPPEEEFPFYRFYAGVDFGFRHPAFVLLMEDEWGRYIVADELLGENISVIDFFTLLKRRMREKFKLNLEDITIFGDVAGSYREQGDGTPIIKKIRDRFGINILTYKQKVMEGVYLIKDWLTTKIEDEPKLKVYKGCSITLSGFLGRFQQDELGRPIKDGYYEHIHDALRYAVYGIDRISKHHKIRIRKPEINYF